jgi:hypothetical protein
VLKQRVKIISGWSNPGGSTIHHISLTNLLNDNGYDCTFYGPHDWHLDKCKAKKIQEADVNVHDIVISHFIQLPPIRLRNVKKHILSCHESNLFPLKKIQHSHYDVIQFVSNKQKAYHSVNHPAVIIPPRVDKFDWKDPENNIAGVIGSIDPHKQVHISVSQALKDGYEKVYLYGQINDLPYFNGSIQPLIEKGKVVVKNHADDKEAMYGSVSAVYHNSKFETYGLVEAECKLAGVPYRGVENNPEVLTDEEVLKRWKDILT